MLKEEREADRYTKDKWYQNIWYHYKIPICIVAFLIITVFFFVYSSSLKTSTDIQILYITCDPEVYSERIIGFENTLTEYAEDWTEDGKTVVFLDNVYIGDAHEKDTVYENKEHIMTTLRAGTSMLIFMDHVGLEYMVSSEALCDLAEEVPELGLSGTYVHLNGTAFMDNHDMPAWGRPLYMGLRVYKGTVAELNSASQANFENAKKMFIKIITENGITDSDREPYISENAD